MGGTGDPRRFRRAVRAPRPAQRLVKLRTFAEQVVLFIYHKHGLPKPYQSNLNDLLISASFIQAVPRVIVSKLHSLRIHGNKAAHGESVLASDRPLAAPGSLRAWAAGCT